MWDSGVLRSRFLVSYVDACVGSRVFVSLESVCYLVYCVIMAGYT
jgi:hypothetical protein